MLIFVIPTSYPNPSNPVANPFIKEQVAALSKINANIVVLNVRKMPTKSFFKNKKSGVFFENDGCSDIVYNNHKTFFEKYLVCFNQWLFTRSMRKLYLEAVKKYGKPDVIYAHFYSAADAALKITKSENIPIITLEHSGLIMSDKLDYRHKKQLKNAVLGSSEYIVTSAGLKKYVEKHTQIEKELKLIPNIIDDSFNYHDRVKKDKFVFFALSRFSYDKRIDLLVDAFISAFSADDNVELRIGGDGKEFDKIQNQISSANREGQIKLLGRLDRKEALSEMINCDAFVLPSRHETFGLVWREAMCVGRPVITTDHGGFGLEDWSDDFGIMIPVDDINALIGALRRIYRDYDGYDLMKISSKNLKMYSSSEISQKLIKIFKECEERK